MIVDSRATFANTIGHSPSRMERGEAGVKAEAMRKVEV